MALKQHVSLLMMPFHTKHVQQRMMEPTEQSIWQPCQISFDKGKLYPHIAQFLKPDNNEGNIYHYQYYSLSPDAEDIRKMLKTPMAIEVKDSVGERRHIYFSLGEAEESKEERFFSPKLVICPSAGVGMLIFSVHLDNVSSAPDNFTINNLIDLNYAIFKTYSLDSSQTQHITLRSQAEIIRSQQELDSLPTEGAEKERTKIEGKLKGMCAKLPEKLQAIDRALGRTPAASTAEAHWTMTELVERLMSEFTDQYERFDLYRLHVFTYLQVDEGDLSPDLFDDFVRIIKLQNSNYLTIDTQESHPIYERSFQNVYLGCTVEGGAIMTLASAPSLAATQTSNFIRDFMRSSLSQSYVWTYMMIQIQRYTLLFLEQQLTQHSYLQNSTVERNTLRDLIGRTTQNKLSSYFIDISDHTQHNQFYSMCCRNLHVKEYSKSIEQKLEMLTDYLKMLTEQSNEEESKRLANSSRVITVICAVFALFSSTYDAYQLFGEVGIFNSHTPLLLRTIIVLGSIAIIAYLLRVALRMYIKRKK